MGTYLFSRATKLFYNEPYMYIFTLIIQHNFPLFSPKGSINKTWVTPAF